MGNIPTNRVDLLAFASAHASIWVTNEVQIGLSPAQATAVQQAVSGVTTANSAALTARAASRTATETLTTRFADLRSAVSDAMSTINAFAQNASKPSQVYALAQIAPPSPRGPSVPPVAPTELNVTLNPSTGSLVLKWKVAQPAGVFGVVYNVRRRIGNGPLTHLGATGEKQFEDDAIPAGTAELSYMIQSQRGSLTSTESITIAVRFGVGGGGFLVSPAHSIVTGPTGEPMKLAA